MLSGWDNGCCQPQLECGNNSLGWEGVTIKWKKMMRQLCNPEVHLVESWGFNHGDISLIKSYHCLDIVPSSYLTQIYCHDESGLNEEISEVNIYIAKMWLIGLARLIGMCHPMWLSFMETCTLHLTWLNLNYFIVVWLKLNYFIDSKEINLFTVNKIPPQKHLTTVLTKIKINFFHCQSLCYCQ